jgi:hypothetical protein
MSNICPAARTLVDQVDKRWPDRIKEKDSFADTHVHIDPSLDGKKDSSKSINKFIDEMVQLAKEGRDEGRLSSISYKNKIASDQTINKFWVWQENNDSCETIFFVFNAEKIYNKKSFPIELFKTKKRSRGEYPKYPGTSSVKFKRKNRSIRTMQERLIKKGFLIPEKELGYYGQETCESVKRFYRSMGIYSGTIAKEGKRMGPKGWKRLFE